MNSDCLKPKRRDIQASERTLRRFPHHEVEQGNRSRRPDFLAKILMAALKAAAIQSKKPCTIVEWAGSARWRLWGASRNSTRSEKWSTGG